MQMDSSVTGGTVIGWVFWLTAIPPMKDIKIWHVGFKCWLGYNSNFREEQLSTAMYKPQKPRPVFPGVLPYMYVTLQKKEKKRHWP